MLQTTLLEISSCRCSKRLIEARVGATLSGGVNKKDNSNKSTTQRKITLTTHKKVYFTTST